MRAILLSTLLLTGCATATRWAPCPDRLVVGGAVERGTVNGSDLAKLVQGGEADGVDSNYEGWSAGGEIQFALGKTPEECPTLGGVAADSLRPQRAR